MIKKKIEPDFNTQGSEIHVGYFAQPIAGAMFFALL